VTLVRHLKLRKQINLVQILNIFQAMSQTQPNVYETCDPTYLQQLRGQVGMDVVQLARIACLSVAQVKSLEAGGNDLFYSQAIKRQAYKRILMILGAPPPAMPSEPTEEDVILPTVIAPVNESLNHIADLTTQPVDDWNSAASAGFGASRRKVALAGLAFAVTFGGVLAVYPSGDNAPMTLASADLSEKTDQPVRAAVSKPASLVPIPVVAAAPVVVASEAVKPASAAVAVVARTAGACAFSSEPGPEVSPAAPKKEGKFVYLVSPTDTTLCIVDGNKQANAVPLKAGEGRSVYGSSPWQISGSSLAQVQIYFQGWRASLPEGAVQKIVLVEKTLTP
jgi:hypothetical protein